MHDDRAPVLVDQALHREPVGREPRLDGPVLVHEEHRQLTLRD